MLPLLPGTSQLDWIYTHNYCEQLPTILNSIVVQDISIGLTEKSISLHCISFYNMDLFPQKCFDVEASVTSLWFVVCETWHGPSPLDANLIMTDFLHQPPSNLDPLTSLWHHNVIVTSQVSQGSHPGSQMAVPQLGGVLGNWTGVTGKVGREWRWETSSLSRNLYGIWSIKVSPIRLIRHHVLARSRYSSSDEFLKKGRKGFFMFPKGFKMSPPHPIERCSQKGSRLKKCFEKTPLGGPPRK